jgi:hypothetical protein
MGGPAHLDMDHPPALWPDCPPISYGWAVQGNIEDSYWAAGRPSKNPSNLVLIYFEPSSPQIALSLDDFPLFNRNLSNINLSHYKHLTILLLY